jgi:hypothetical protein
MLLVLSNSQSLGFLCWLNLVHTICISIVWFRLFDRWLLLPVFSNSQSLGFCADWILVHTICISIVWFQLFDLWLMLVVFSNSQSLGFLCWCVSAFQLCDFDCLIVGWCCWYLANLQSLDFLCWLNPVHTICISIVWFRFFVRWLMLVVFSNSRWLEREPIDSVEFFTALLMRPWPLHGASMCKQSRCCCRARREAP